MEDLIYEYFKDGAKKLHMVVDNMLRKIGGLSDKDKDDFYSAASMAIAETWYKNMHDEEKYYNEEKGTEEKYLCKVIRYAIIDELRDRNRYKRSNTRPKRNDKGEIVRKNGKIEYDFVLDVSISTPISENVTIGDVLADNFNIEREIIEEEETYSDKTIEYLNKLSILQRKILNLKIDGYSTQEIIEELHITQEQYLNCNEVIHSYRNISILF